VRLDASLRQRTIAFVPLLVLGVVLVALALIAYHYWPAAVGYARNLQASLHRDLATAMHALEAQEGKAFWSLVSISFLYGVFHAVGPGHGKVVIATYIASHPEQLRRGLIISVLSSLTQGITAIVMVGAGYLLFDVTARNTKGLATHLETFSFALIAALGLYLLARAARGLYRTWRANGDHAHDHGACGHHHHHGDAIVPTDSKGRETWLHVAMMIVSIGIRPCSGAILILILAAALGLMLSGSLAVLAMSLGTAITVGLLAVVAQSARRYATTLAHHLPADGGLWQIGAHIAAMAGGLIILLFGLSLLAAALAPQAAHPLI